MEIMEDDVSSSSISSSSTSQSEIRETRAPPSTSLPKRKAGRKKFKETRHPIYRGVRLRNGNKWVCEVREPNKKSRIWLGTFPTPEMAARAYDAAILTLRGDDSPLNFPDSARLIRRAKSTSNCDIQEAAHEAALAFKPKCYDEMPSSSSLSYQSEKSDIKVDMAVDVPEAMFVDEEALFNMPSFYNSMAEGLVITPPGMKKGFNWSDAFDSNIDLTLWRH